ncbi:MAG: thioredoxin family protein, partial [Flavobacteriales bacterium]|nr:thioredoxin family protein [Flavobacteriales bacterium]
YKDASAVKEKFLENAIDALLNKKEVPVKTTRAIGCTIKV